VDAYTPFVENDGEVRLPDGRTVGYADYGASNHTAVVWCHGGPGSRFEPQAAAAAGRDAGLRLIGIDRPGYGLSTPRPGRDIASWVPDALAVVDHLGIDRFVTVGMSTGGAYALALASRSERVLGTVACCALTDMRWAEGKAAVMRNNAPIAEIWSAPDRAAALAFATESMGADGSKMLALPGTGPELPPADLALFANPEWLAGMVGGFQAMFAHGVQGYVDDRLADGPGWGSFNVGAVRCPVIVLHGGKDSIVPVAQAHYTGKIVPGATVSIFDELGHFSIGQEAGGAILEVLARAARR
jgi:pimeloyl-ACP methyl ester carboxylesterase